jgi:hypothetical protein
MDHLSIADADHVIPEQHEGGIVRVVGIALRSDMVAAVDLQDEPLADEQVDAVAGDPDLAPQRQTHPPQPGHDDRLQSRVGPDLRRREHTARRPEGEAVPAPGR